MIGLLLGGILCVWGTKMYLSNSDDLKIRNYLGNESRTLMVEILEREKFPKRRRCYYLMDKSIDELCFVGQVNINGINRKVTVIADAKTEIGKVYMMNGWLYPSWKLFLPRRERLYLFHVRRGFWLPYLMPKVVIKKVL